MDTEGVSVGGADAESGRKRDGTKTSDVEAIADAIQMVEEMANPLRRGEELAWVAMLIDAMDEEAVR